VISLAIWEAGRSRSDVAGTSGDEKRIRLGGVPERRNEIPASRCVVLAGLRREVGGKDRSGAKWEIVLCDRRGHWQLRTGSPTRLGNDELL